MPLSDFHPDTVFQCDKCHGYEKLDRMQDSEAGLFCFDCLAAEAEGEECEE